MRAQQFKKRPFGTLYYTSVTDKQPSVSSHGACATERGAIRAAVPRIFMREYAMASVVDRALGVVIYTVKLGPKGLEVHYGSLRRENSNIRRVK